MPGTMVLRLGATRYSITMHEAGVLHDWLDETESPAGIELAATLRHEEVSSAHPHVLLGLENIAVLRRLLCGTGPLADMPGLAALQAALCADPDAVT